MDHLVHTGLMRIFTIRTNRSKYVVWECYSCDGFVVSKMSRRPLIPYLKHLKMISSQFNSNSKLNSFRTVSHREQNAYKVSFYGACNLCKIRPSHKTSKAYRTILQWKVIKTPVNVPYDIITVFQNILSIIINLIISVGWFPYRNKQLLKTFFNELKK